MDYKSYEELLPSLKSLEAEVLFILNQAINKQQIKIHLISSRIKQYASARAKLERMEEQRDNPKTLSNISDLVGVRIVCLFRSDIEKIGNLIRNSFSVKAEDNKIDGAETASFGYQSVHFIANLPSHFSGPRYDQIKTNLFEIQVRTIAMDAWAATSHYLDYKSELGVPSNMRKDFFALSGLFYVADTHFEMFYKEVTKAREKTSADAESGVELDQELNFDTLKAYLRRVLPDRKGAKSADISDLLDELLKTGYKNISELNSTFENGINAFAQYERDNPPSRGGKYWSVGVLRILLEIADENFLNFRMSEPDASSISEDHWNHFRQYRKYLKN